VSKSYKKNPHCSAPSGVRREDREIYHRNYRTRCKLAIKTCVDWDELDFPRLEGIEGHWYYWDTKQFCSCRYKKPLINECEVKLHEAIMQDYTWRIKSFKNGHLRDCNCFTNPKGRYQKACRK
jgi:hypothetical protein